MSDANAFDFGKFIPGFDFLQKLSASAPGAGGAAPGLHSWVAPTVSVDELDKRIKELKAVLFWLEQNGTALKATIQALEVQKMTLAALAGMNLNMAEVAKAFTVPTGGAGTTAAPPAEPPRPEGWPYATAPMPASAAKQSKMNPPLRPPSRRSKPRRPPRRRPQPPRASAARPLPPRPRPQPPPAWPTPCNGGARSPSSFSTSPPTRCATPRERQRPPRQTPPQILLIQ